MILNWSGNKQPDPNSGQTYNDTSGWIEKSQVMMAFAEQYQELERKWWKGSKTTAEPGSQHETQFCGCDLLDAQTVNNSD